ncbi:MAG TPA: YceI family protein [Vicinamibacterales bacterium]
MRRLPLLAVIVALAPALTFVPAPSRLDPHVPPAGTWQLDPQRSVVEFTVTKLGFADVTGRFLDFAGTVRYDAVQPEHSSVEWIVKVASVRTDAANRDRSLQAPEYFDAARHPELSFRSTRVSALDAGRLQVEGAITIRGTRRPLTLIATPIAGGFETRFELDRYDFGVVGGRVMSRLVGRTVRIHLRAIAHREDT